MFETDSITTARGAHGPPGFPSLGTFYAPIFRGSEAEVFVFPALKGQQHISPGQRPGIAIQDKISPERATDYHGDMPPFQGYHVDPAYPGRYPGLRYTGPSGLRHLQLAGLRPADLRPQ